MKAESLKTKIENLSQQQLNVSYQLIAQYLLKNIERLKNIKIKDIVQNAFCSSSTVIKMCHEFGYSTFKEFLFELANEYSYYNSKSDMYLLNKPDNIVVKEYTKKIIGNISEVYLENEHLFIPARTFLQNKRNVFIFCTGVNLKAGSYLSMILISLGYNTYFSADLDELNWYGTQYMDQESVCIFLSYSFIDRRIVQQFNFALEQRAKIMVFSRNKNIKPKCNLFFRIGENESLLDRKHNALISIFYLINAIMFAPNK